MFVVVLILQNTPYLILYYYCDVVGADVAPSAIDAAADDDDNDADVVAPVVFVTYIPRIMFVIDLILQNIPY